MEKYKKDLIPIIIIVLVSLPIKLQGILKGYFAFTYDQGRDFIEVSKILGGNLTLIGPTTGIHGIFYGPWWYYFLAPILFFAKGDPKIVAVVFGLISIATLVALYLLTLKIIGNKLISLLVILIVSASSSWIVLTLIWSPTLTTILLVFYFMILLGISKSPTRINFFIYGVVLMLIADTSASFTAFIVPFSLIITPLVFRNILLRKELVFSYLGVLVVASPRIMFEIKNKFLMSKTFLSFLNEPKVYGPTTQIQERIVFRANDYLEMFSELFAKNSKSVSILILFALIIVLTMILRTRKLRTLISNDFLFKYTTLLTLATFVYFVLYPDNVWRYYLVGVPIAILVLFSFFLKYLLKILRTQIVVLCIIALLVFNIQPKLFIFDNKWQGSGADYVNQVRVLDYISEQNPRNYTIQFFTSSMIDYPFMYLTAMYEKIGKLKPSDGNIKYKYLVIRDYNVKNPYKDYWYDQQTQDSLQIIETKTFPGEILLEVHRIRLENG